MKKTFLFIVISFLPLFLYSQAENNEPKKFFDKIFYGGNLGLQLGTVTLIELSPFAGYKITEKLAAGAGITYLFFRDNQYKYQTSIYGGRLFGKYFILDNIFAHAEYEVLNMEPIINTGIQERINITNILVGAGYRQHLGGKAYMNLLLLWNINESALSPYSNPVIRGGVSFGM